MEKYFNVQQVSEITGYTPAHIRFLIKTGELPAYKRSSYSDWRFREIDIEKLFERSLFSGPKKKGKK